MPVAGKKRAQVTPPTTSGFEPNSVGSRTASLGSWSDSRGVSPNSVATHLTTPPRSPVRPGCKTLLPKVHTSDSYPPLQPAPVPNYHRKAVSVSSAYDHGHYSTHAPRFQQRYETVSSAGSSAPPISGMPYMLTPTSATPHDTNLEYNQYVPSQPVLHAQSHSMISTVAHSRSSSESMVHSQVYRGQFHQPYVTSTGAAYSGFLIPSPMRPAPSLTAELSFDSYAKGTKETSLLEYLTAPNPAPQIVYKYNAPSRTTDKHFWWDVRNVRTWDDFDIDTIRAIPGFAALLDVVLPEPALQRPSTSCGRPESTAALQKIYAEFYATKINSALNVAANKMRMRSVDQQHATDQPNFVARLSNEGDYILTGEGRVRLVGIVRSYEQWNSAMRDDPVARMSYLRELAHLHKFMRGHSCRYGYILTEVELVCVRAGKDRVPHYGFMELSAPIALSTHGPGKLTACLALWYMHMLVTPTPLEGQCGWYIDVGEPSQMSRKNCLAVDGWINLKPHMSEKRDAKRNRGFALPTDPFDRKREGKGGAGSSKARKKK